MQNMPLTWADDKPVDNSLRLFRLSEVYPSVMPKNVVIEADQSSNKRLQCNNKLETSLLLNVQGSLQISDLFR